MNKRWIISFPFCVMRHLTLFSVGIGHRFEDTVSSHLVTEEFIRSDENKIHLNHSGKYLNDSSGAQ